MSKPRGARASPIRSGAASGYCSGFPGREGALRTTTGRTAIWRNEDREERQDGAGTEHWRTWLGRGRAPSPVGSRSDSDPAFICSLRTRRRLSASRRPRGHGVVFSTQAWSHFQPHVGHRAGIPGSPLRVRRVCKDPSFPTQGDGTVMPPKCSVRSFSGWRGDEGDAIRTVLRF